ncbi:hypothetical protein FKM82_008102 [Ascaphus truei]
MKSKRGRTGRKRKKKTMKSKHSPVNQSHECEYIELKRWLKERGFQDGHLRTAEFADTGRGLMTTRLLQPGELIISLPEKCLITTRTVLQSYLGKYITGWDPPISPLLALCTFLITEKYAGDQSPWKPYLAVLPTTYSCPVYWEPEMVNLLPEPVRKQALEQNATVHKLYISSLPFFNSLQSLFHESAESILTYDALRWAWCTVNTRTVYMKHAPRACFSAEQDIYALAPYLDLLNHSPRVQVDAAFSEKSRCYEIRTRGSCKKYDQVFICYGPHDNQRLLLEYGFVAAGNPHCSVFVSKDVILQYLSRNDKQISKKWSLLRENGFLDTCWKKVLLGSVISDSNERTTLALARKICFHLQEETDHTLKEISRLRNNKRHLENQVVLVEALSLEELKILQTSAEMLQNGHSVPF